MTFLFYISLLCYLAGALSFQKPKPGYLLGCAGAICSLAFACSAWSRSVTIIHYRLTAGIDMTLGIDHLSALFLLIAALSWIALAIYSIDYSALYPQKKLVLGFNAAIAGMQLILVARDGFSLLIGWEVMTIFAFLMMLVTEENYERAYRFLAFGELSTACLLLGFAVLYKTAGSLAFDALPKGTSLILVLLSLGLLIKMDIVPFHAWMRGIYAGIPDNTAAFLSAPVTLMGVYGLERIIPLLPESQTWNMVLVLLGALSAFWGGLQAVAVGEVRLLPAYSTVENNGMILTAIGFYGLASRFPGADLQYLALFAQAASLILALSHTLAKTLLFLSLGHAKEAYNVPGIDQARGVWSGVGRIPALGILVSALCFSAFPPLIGYAGEWMLLETIFQSYRFPGAGIAFSGALAGVLTALAIGLIGFAMIKLIGYTALGYDHGRKTRPIPNRLMHAVEIGLLVAVIGCGIALPAIIYLFGYPNLLTGLLGIPRPFLLASNQPPFGVISPTFIALTMIVLLILPCWIFLNRQKKVRRVHSWNGGIRLREAEFYSAPAYSEILEHVLRKVYHTREIQTPARSGIEIEDVLIRPTRILTRLVGKIGEAEALVLMNGKISAYVTYILILFVLSFVIGMLVL